MKFQSIMTQMLLIISQFVWFLMSKIKLVINLILAITVAGCTGSLSLEVNQRAANEYLVSCPPQIFYCYRKSDLICHRGYRVIKVSISEENPEMNIKCNWKFSITIQSNICLQKRKNIKYYGVRIAQYHETKKERIFFLMGLQYLFKPHTLIGLSFQHFSFLIH